MTKGEKKKKLHQFPESCLYIVNYDAIDAWTAPEQLLSFSFNNLSQVEIYHFVQGYDKGGTSVSKYK